MARYYVYACEEQYRGMHGVEDMRVVEDTLEGAFEWGESMLIDLISFYALDEDDDDDFEEEGYYEVYEIRSDVALSIDELNSNLYYEDKDSFIEKYCYPKDLA